MRYQWFVRLISVIIVVIIIFVPLISAARTVEVDFQAFPLELSSINEKSNIQISFNISQDIKSISNGMIKLDVPEDVHVEDENIRYGNLSKVRSYLDDEGAFTVVFNVNNINKNRTYELQIPVTCNVLGNYNIYFKDGIFKDERENKTISIIKKRLINIHWGSVCSTDNCENQNGLYGEPHEINNIMYQKIKKNCHCHSGMCKCDEETKIYDIVDINEYISVEPSVLNLRDNVTLRANFKDFCNETGISSFSLSYRTDENSTYNRTWRDKCYIEEKINNLSLGHQNINFNCKFNFYNNMNCTKACQKSVIVNELKGIEVYCYVAPSTVNVGDNFNIEIWCTNNNNHEIDNLSLNFTLPKGFSKRFLQFNFDNISQNGHARSDSKLQGTVEKEYQLFKDYSYNYSYLGKNINGNNLIKTDVKIKIIRQPSMTELLIRNILTFLGGVIIGIFANAIWESIKNLYNYLFR